MIFKKSFDYKTNEKNINGNFNLWVPQGDWENLVLTNRPFSVPVDMHQNGLPSPLTRSGRAWRMTMDCYLELLNTKSGLKHVQVP